MTKKDGLQFIALSVIISIIIFVLDVAFHALAVPGMYVGYPQRPQIEIASLMPFLFLTYVVQIMMFLWLFRRLYPQGGTMRAIWWGLWGGLFVVLPNMQFFVGVAGTTWTLLLTQVVEAIVLLIFAATVFDIVWRRLATA